MKPKSFRRNSNSVGKVRGGLTKPLERDPIVQRALSIVMSSDDVRTFSGQPVDEHGNPVERTKEMYPYSYDGFVIWRTEGKANDTIYSDRLLQWDFAKHDRLCMKHFGNKGQYWSDRPPEKIEAFLRDWCDNPKLKLIFIMQYCNVSSGFPCWRFDFNTNRS
jgi:hypothetical protein